MNEKAKDKVQEIIEASGNNFHSNVIKFLREKEWHVLISPYYNDNVSDKAREIDIIAEKAFAVKSPWGEIQKWLNVRLIIECKYVNSETVFWFDAKDKKKAEEMLVRNTPLKKDNAYTLEHHYMGDYRVAKLFTSEKNKDLSSEPLYKAINQSLNAMVYFRHAPSLIRVATRSQIRTVCYPVIILNDFGKIFAVNIGASGYAGITDKFFQLEINYAYLDSGKQNMNEYFLIDVVNFSYFDDFLNEIQTKDVEAMKVMVAPASYKDQFFQ